MRELIDKIIDHIERVVQEYGCQLIRCYDNHFVIQKEFEFFTIVEFELILDYPFKISIIDSSSPPMPLENGMGFTVPSPELFDKVGLDAEITDQFLQFLKDSLEDYNDRTSEED